MSINKKYSKKKTLSMDDCQYNVKMTKKLKKLIQKTPLMFQWNGNKNRIAKLFYFAIQAVLEGADINVQDDSKFKGLISLGIEYNQVAFVKFLVDKGADLNIRDWCNVTPLMVASISNNNEIAKILIENGADLNLQDDIDRTALQMAITGFNDEIAEMLIKKGADLNLQDYLGKTALMLASVDNYDITKLLIENKADLDLQDAFGDTALIQAASLKNFDIVKLLVENGADLNLKDNNGNTAIMHAVENYDFEMCNYLIEKGADVSLENNKGKSFLDKFTSLTHDLEKKVFEEKQQKKEVNQEHMIK